MFSMFLWSYRNTRESLEELKKSCGNTPLRFSQTSTHFNFLSTYTCRCWEISIFKNLFHSSAPWCRDCPKSLQLPYSDTQIMCFAFHRILLKVTEWDALINELLSLTVSLTTCDVTFFSNFCSDTEVSNLDWSWILLTW